MVFPGNATFPAGSTAFSGTHSGRDGIAGHIPDHPADNGQKFTVSETSFPGQKRKSAF
jgi:hypothetical protein